MEQVRAHVRRIELDGAELTPAELNELTFFREGERYLGGKIIDWSVIDARAMQAIDKLRGYLDSPIHLIRGPHPNRPSAVDACCPGKPLSVLFLALTRLYYASWGIYSGGSFHVDVREFQGFPARWMAVKVEEEGILKERGLAELEGYRANGWIYLKYHHDRAFEGIQLVCELAERKAS
jgi:hypothetical protein